MKYRTTMIITCFIIGILIITFFIGKVILHVKFSKQVKRLFLHSINSSNQKFDYAQLDSLPDPAQRYFKYILKEGQPYISTVRMTHNGLFKTGFDKGWTNINGEQYATIENPGFIWKGTTNMFVARDMYIENTGRLTVSLFSLLNIVNATGEQYNQGELLRWLGESVLYPTNLLPSNKLKWFPIDSYTAKLTFDYNELSLFFIISFNTLGEITEMETKRYMDENHLETWVIKVADYKELNNVLVPTNFEVLWRLEKGDFSYAKFTMEKIEYNKPLIF